MGTSNTLFVFNSRVNKDSRGHPNILYVFIEIVKFLCTYFGRSLEVLDFILRGENLTKNKCLKINFSSNYLLKHTIPKWCALMCNSNTGEIMALLTLELLSEKYGLNLASIKSMKHMGRIPSYAFHKDRKNIYAKEEYFVSRINFFHKCVEISQRMVYLLEEHFSISEISRAILIHNNIEVTHAKTVSMSSILREGLFTRYEGAELLTVNKLIWYAARYSWAIERRLKRKGTTIEKILNRREYES